MNSVSRTIRLNQLATLIESVASYFYLLNFMAEILNHQGVTYGYASYTSSYYRWMGY
nr:MAG TPA: hypothetical protein [Caudoviricetes sp.]